MLRRFPFKHHLCRKQQPLLIFSQRFFSADIAPPASTNYYVILGIKQTATQEEIKNAYRSLAKKYHPDVNTTGQTHEPDAERFRQIAEAYAVLSVQESRNSYDLTYKRTPDAIFSANRDESLEKGRAKRDRTGHVKRDPPKRGSYAEFRMRELEEMRKKYNANHLGIYDGGLPQPRGYARGKAICPPGYFHLPHNHQIEEPKHQDSTLVGGLEAMQFKHYMKTDQPEIERTIPWYPLKFDPDYRSIRDRAFYLAILGSFAALTYVKAKAEVERRRLHRLDRMSNIEKMPAHHFVNRGGVLIKKEVEGFEKYHQNLDSLMSWYKRAFPQGFETAD